MRDAVRDGELAAAAYLETALAHLPHETDPAIVQGVLAFASAHIADRYLPADERPAALNTLSALCSDLIHRTGGDNPGLRLIAVRHFIDVAAELRRDPSATGQEGAARCRAALPDEEAKAKAWEATFATGAGNDLSNYLFTATAQGFWQPEQLDLLLTYVPRYYPDAIALAARRGPAIARAAAKHAFPIYAVNAETLRLGQECLSNGAPTPMLRRGLADQLDDLARALRVRER